MDLQPVQGRVAIHLGMHHAKEIGTSSGGLGPGLVCTFSLHYQMYLNEATTQRSEYGLQESSSRS